MFHIRTNRVQRIAFLSLTALLIGFALLSYQSRAARVGTSRLSAPSAAPMPKLSIAAPLPAPTCAPPPPNMTAWFPGDGDAHNLIDANHGALHGGLGFAAGKVGQAFNLDGTDDYVSVASTPELNFGLGDFSLDVWVKTSSTGLQVIVDKRVDNRSQATPNAITGYALFAVNGVVGFQMADGGLAPGYENFISSLPIADGQFHHIAVTVDRDSTTGGKIYVDNLAPFIFNPTGRQSSLDNTAELRIGRIATPNQDSLDAFFNGSIDELEIFKRALSETEVGDIRNADDAGKCKPTCVAPPAGMVSWYPGDGNANDIKGANNGTLQNGATFAVGKVGQALSLDGVNAYVNVSNNSALEPANLTVDMWIKSGSPGSGAYLLAKGADTCSQASYSFNNAGTGGGLAFDVNIAGTLIRSPFSSPAIFDNNWHHVAGTYDGSAVRLYVDGVQVGSGTAASGAIKYALPTTNDLTFGRFNGTCQTPLSYGGLLDEIEIFDHALTLTEIQSIFNASSAGKCKGCVAAPPDLQAWYTGDGNADDIQGPTFENGTLQNGATASTLGKVGTAFNFANAAYVDVLNSPALEPANLTVDMWIKSGSPGAAAYLLAKGADTCSQASYSFNTGGTGGGLAFDVNIAGTLMRSPFSSPAIFDGNWHHVAGTYDGAFVRLYVDGVQVGTGTATSGAIKYGLPTTNNLTLGRFNGTCVLSYTGLLDEVEIFSRALTQAEIQSIFNADSAGKCRTDLSITKTDSQTSATPGTPITYTITVTNNGTIPVSGASVTDAVPAEITGVNWSCAASVGSSCGASNGSGNSINTTVNLLPGGTATFTVTGNISSGAGGALSNTASVAAPAGVLDTNLTNNSQNDTNTLTPEADLKLTKLAAPDPVFVGSNVTYTLTVQNLGPSDAGSSVVTDALPSGVIFVSASAGCTHASGTVTCNIGPLANGASATATITVRPTLPGSISNTAQITAFTTPDPISGNGTSTASVTAQTPPCAPPPTGLTGWWPGDGNANDIRGGNNGALQNGATATATGLVRQTFTFDGVNDFVSVPNNAALEPKQITVDMWVKSANPGANAYLLSKGAQGCSFASYAFNNAPGDNVANGDLAFDVVTTVSGFKRSPGIPKAQVFDGNWHHVTGTYDGAKVRIYLDGVEVGSGTTATGDLKYALSSTNNLFFGRFNGPGCVLSYAGALDEIEIFDRALTPAEIQAIAQAYSTGKCQSDLSITKTHLPSTATPGQPVTFTITVTNNGPVIVTGATVNDSFPGAISGVNWTCTASPGSSCGAGSGSGNINTTVNLAIGGTATFTATGLISAAATGSLTNTATVTAPASQPDPASGNNTASDTVPLAPKTDLEITKTASPPNSVFVGSNLTYTITVKNNGPSNSSGSSVTDVLPGNVLFVSASSGCTNASGTVTCAVGPLASGATKILTIIVKPTASGAISNTATVAASETDPGPGANTSTAAVTAQIPPCAPPPANMSAWFTADGTANDIVGGNIGTLNGGGGYTTGKVGQAFNLDGVNDYASVPSDASLNVGTGDFSIDAWIKTTDASGLKIIVDKRVENPSGNIRGYSLRLFDGQPGIQLADGTNIGGDTFTNFFGGPNVADGIFHHIAVTVDRDSATGGKIYVDGVLEHTFNPTGRQNSLTNTAELRIGAHSLTLQEFLFKGLIDEVEIFKRALSESEIQAIAVADLSGKCRADLSITKTHSPSTGTPGQPVTFTITATNNGSITVNGATVVDNFPGALSSVTWTCAASAGSSCGAGSGSGNINTTVNLAPGGTATFTATGLISSAATGSLSNTATVTSSASAFDPIFNNNSATDTVPLAPKTDLEITKTASPNPVFVGADLIYTIKVKNNGPSNSSGSTVTDVLHASVTFVSASAGCANASGTVTCATGPITSGATVTLTITVKPTTTGSISNTASVAANETDPGPGVNTSTAAVNAVPPPACAPPPANMSAWFTGNNTANDIVGGNVGTLNGGSYAAGKVGQAFNLDGVDDYVSAPNAASLNLGTGDFSIDAWIKTSVSTLQTIVDKRVESPVGVFTGYALFTLNGQLGVQLADGTATNFIGGPNLADGLFHHVAVTVDRDSATGGKLYVDGVAVLTFNPTVRPNSLTNTAELRIGGHSISFPQFSFSGLIDEVEIFKRALSANEIQGIFAADLSGKCQADLAITKTHSPSTGTPGQSVTFTITVTNNGPRAASGATVADTFPAGISGVTWTCAASSGSSCGAGSGSGNINTTVNLAPGGTATFTATGLISSAATGSLSNTATVTAPSSVVDPVSGNNSATDNVPLAPKADLKITKTASPNPVNVGADLTYTISVKNNGPSNSTGSTVKDILPASVTFVSASAGCANASGTVTCAMGPIASGATATVTIVVKPTTPGSISNTAQITAANEPDPGPGANSSTATVTAQVPPCVAPPANMAAWFTGNNTANDIVGGNVGTLNGGSYASGKVGQAFNLDGVDDYVSAPNAASLNLGTGDFSIDAWIKTSDGSGVKTIIDKRVESPATVFTGYHLFLSNGQLGVQLADGTATNFIGGPNLADGFFHHVAVTVDRDSATGGKLYVDGVAVLTFNPTVRPNSLTNTAELRIGGHSISLPSFSFNGLIDEVEIFKRALSANEIQGIFAADTSGKCQTDFSITKTHSPGTGTPGQSVTFTLKVTNNGPRAASGATVNDTFPAGITSVSWTCAASSGSSCGAGNGSGNGNIAVTLGHLAVGGSATFTATAHISSAATGSLSNTATVTAPSSVVDPVSGNNSATDNVPLSPKTDLQITKADSSDPTPINFTLTYTLTAKNNGPSDATNVTVVDTLPGSVTFIPGSSSAGCVEAPAGTVTCTIGNLASGATATRTLVVKPTATGQISNTAVISGNETDPISGNNTATITTTISPPACILPPAGLKFWMPADSSSSGTTPDLVGGPAGTLTNGASIDTSTAGRVGVGALSLNGASDYVRVPNSAALEPASAITVDFWFKSSAPGASAYLLSKGQEGCSFASYSFNNVGGSGGLFFDVTTTAGFFRSPESSPAVFDGNWHLAAGTYDAASGKVRLFIDGVEQGSGTTASGNIRYALATDNDLIIGRYDPGNSCGANVYNYNGLIDEVEIFHVVLPTTGDGSIQSIYDARTAGKCHVNLTFLPGDRRFYADYDGDGKDDLALWRPSTATFFIFKSASQNVTSKQWGVSTDEPVPGDYDGDGKTDIAVWRPSTGAWIVFLSSNGTTPNWQWGASGDVPVPGDYDEDGKTDLAIWRPSTGVWWVFKSATNTTVTTQLGMMGDVPVPGDYDEDGKTDRAVWRPSIATFFILKSGSNNVTVKQWGVSTDVPTPGDYDGDGKTDIAVRRPATGEWFILLSSNGQTPNLQWGNSSDVPTPGDYDGDGKTDLAIWRPSTGVWWIFKSSNFAIVTLQFGTLGDVPLR